MKLQSCVCDAILSLEFHPVSYSEKVYNLPPVSCDTDKDGVPDGVYCKGDLSKTWWVKSELTKDDNPPPPPETTILMGAEQNVLLVMSLFHDECLSDEDNRRALRMMVFVLELAQKNSLYKKA